MKKGTAFALMTAAVFIAAGAMASFKGRVEA